MTSHLSRARKLKTYFECFNKTQMIQVFFWDCCDTKELISRQSRSYNGTLHNVITSVILQHVDQLLLL